MGFPLSSCPKPVKLIYLFSFCLLFYFDISTPYIICIICFCLFCFMSSAPLQWNFFLFIYSLPRHRLLPTWSFVYFVYFCHSCLHPSQNEIKRVLLFKKITNMNCAVMGILGPGYLEPWPVTWRFQKCVYFSRARAEMHLVVFKCSLQTSNVVPRQIIWWKNVYPFCLQRIEKRPYFLP